MDFWLALNNTHKVIAAISGLVAAIGVLVPFLRWVWKKVKCMKARIEWIMSDHHDHDIIKGQLTELTAGLGSLGKQFTTQFEASGNGGIKDALIRFEGKIDFLSAFVRTSLHSHTKAIFETNKDGQITYVNKAYMRLTGYSLQEVVGMGWVNLIKQEDRDKVVGSWMHAVRGKRDYDEFITYVDSKGHELKVHVLAYAIHTNGECILGHFGEITPI